MQDIVNNVQLGCTRWFMRVIIVRNPIEIRVVLHISPYSIHHTRIISTLCRLYSTQHNNIEHKRLQFMYHIAVTTPVSKIGDATPKG